MSTGQSKKMNSEQSDVFEAGTNYNASNEKKKGSQSRVVQKDKKKGELEWQQRTGIKDA